MKLKPVSQNGPLTRALSCFVLALLLAGCGRNDIQVYRVAKETTTPPSSTSGSVPAGWETAPLGEMRVASFHIKGPGSKAADVSVIPLPGRAGSDLDNVNRWRGQVGLPPVAESDFAALGQTVAIGDHSCQLYDQSGKNPTTGQSERILATILRHDDTAWFFKMTGSDDLVAEQKPAFIEFLKSFSFPNVAGGPDPALPPSHPPIGADGSASPASAAAPPSTEDLPAWEVPAGWQAAPAGQFLLAKFIIGGSGNGQTAVNISRSPGNGGGLPLNVNRWRGQIGLAPLSPADVDKSASPVDIPGVKAILFDMNGTDAKTAQPARLLAIVVTQPSQTWFFKLMGDVPVVDHEKPVFLKFVQTVKFSDVP